jgi:HEAT repeat protein
MGPSAAASKGALRRAAAEDRKAEVREAAIHALVRIGVESKETEVLLDALKDPAPAVRSAAAGGLEIWSPDEAGVVPSLINGLGDSNAVVREVCAATLGKYGNKARNAVQPLKKLAASDDPAADYATQALKHIQPVETNEQR